MKLSELVEYLNILQQDYVNPDYQSAMAKIYSLSHVISSNKNQFPVLSDNLQTAFDNVTHSINIVETLVDELKDTIISTIEQLEEQQLQQTQRWYQDEQSVESDSFILNRRIKIDDESNILLRAHLKLCTDWRVPGMIIRPGLESFVEELVPLDPLYLVDHNPGLLKPAMSGFTEQYQRRLRPYAIDDYEHHRPLWQLPDNQYGLIFAWNFLNYKPLSLIDRYLEDFYQKLRPGGTAIFSFNDCDQAHGARLAENNFMSYAPARRLKLQIEKIGFDILYHHRGQGDVSWLEIQKPGKIESIRGGQTLAKIIAGQ